MSQYHQTVLLQEAIEGLQIKPDGTYVDVTFGGGGHTKLILAKLNEAGRVFAFDQDKDAQQNIIDDKRLTLIPQNFRYVKRFLRINGVLEVDGILADLGVSWHQFNTKERGFSIRFDDDELDMRMNQQDKLTAKDVVNTYDERALFNVFKQYGELKKAYWIAKAIVQSRTLKPINTVKELKEISGSFIKGNRKAHKFYAQLFQALRIEVNKEMEALQELLLQSADILVPKGRLVVIAYHSVEDRLVKNYIKKGSFDGTEEKDIFGNTNKPFNAINRKIIIPTANEMEINPKSTSAKMRIAEKI